MRPFKLLVSVVAAAAVATAAVLILTAPDTAPDDGRAAHEGRRERTADERDRAGTGAVPAPTHGHEVGAHNTGPTAYVDPDLGRTLTHADLEPSGSITTSHDGQVIERLDITGHITIAHSGVTIRAVRIHGTTSRYAISYAPGSGATGASIHHVEVDGGNNPDNIGVYLDHFTLRHSNIHGQSTGVRFGSGSTIEYNYVHSQALSPGSHNTAMSMHGGTGAVVRGNNLEGSTSSALSLYPRLAPLVDILVEANLFNGGSYCTYAGAGPKQYAPDSHHIRYLGNHFGRALHPKCGEHGPVAHFSSDADGNEWAGNTWHDTGEPIG